ncbi:hypothetical protein JOH51_004897 [Rhizobium leguminosarum]|nr:hypothetical protein [Rhizobium leguminosarum]
MAARASWKGHLKVGDLACAVGLYSGHFLVPLGHRLVGDVVDIAAFDAVLRLTIEDVETQLIALDRHRRQRDHGGDERELEIAFPEGLTFHVCPASRTRLGMAINGRFGFGSGNQGSRQMAPRSIAI